MGRRPATTAGRTAARGPVPPLERCQRGDLDVTGWLSWFLEQLTAAAATNGAVIDAVRRKAAFWWSHRHSGFNSRQQKLLNRLLDSEPEGFTGGMTLRKAIGLTKVSRAISADTDLRLCRVLGLNPGYWRQFHAAAMQHCVSTQLLQIPD